MDYNKILNELTKNKEYISSMQIADDLMISEKTVIRTVKILRRNYNIQSKSGRGGGYRYISKK